MRWQVWIALLLDFLPRFQASLGDWPDSFSLLFDMIRGVIRNRINLPGLLKIYGTADGPLWRMRAQPEQAFLPGFAPNPVGWHVYIILESLVGEYELHE